MKLLGYGLIVAGGVGAYSRYTVNAAANAANPALTSNLTKYDPAKLVGITPGAALFDLGMIFDLALVGAGIYLVTRG